jgi:soluble cytochrome b562
MRATRTRAAAALTTIALAGGLGACGGGGDDSSKKDYQSALDSFCKSVESGSNKVQTDASSVQTTASSDPKAAIKKIGTVLGTFATTIDDALTKLKGADVPSDYQDFNDGAVKGVDELVTKVRAAAKAASTGNVQAVTQLGSTLNDIKLPDLPKELADKAPSCSRISK